LSLSGVALALPQLRVMVDEQRRLNESLSKRPGFSISFEIAERSSADPLTILKLIPAWRDGEELSEPITFGVVAENIGTGTAREVHWNIHIPGPVQVLRSAVPCRNPEPASDHLYEGYMPYIHVGARITGWFTIHIARSQSGQQFVMNMSVTMADASMALQHLTLIISDSQERRAL
jgi:hypothetical protein